MKNVITIILFSLICNFLVAQIPVGLEVKTVADTSISVVNTHTNNPMAIGGYFEVNSVNGVAVKGAAIGDDNGDGVGGHFISSGSDGRAVVGEATFTGQNAQTFGGLFRSHADHSFGVWATSSLGNDSYAIVGEANGTHSLGVNGVARGDDGIGVEGDASGDNGIGVFGRAPAIGGIGVRGEAIMDGDLPTYGGYFVQDNGRGTGASIYAEADHQSCLNCGTGIIGKGGLVGISGENIGSAIFGVGVIGKSAIGIGVQGNGSRFDFDATGAGIDFHSSSSIRWKTNVLNISAPLDKLEALRGVSFTWDEEHGGHNDIGFIAEEVGDILPEIVGYDENGTDATGMDYSRVTALLVEAAKAMRQEYMEMAGAVSDQLASYQQEITHLKNLNESLERQNTELKDHIKIIDNSVSTLKDQVEKQKKNN